MDNVYINLILRYVDYNLEEFIVKKHLLKLLAALPAVLLFLCLNTQTAFAETTWDGVWEYEVINDDEIKITKYLPGEGEYVTVPEEIDDMTVTMIDDEAFKEKSIVNVVLSNVTKIGNKAFEGCLALKSVEMRNVTTIGDNAFGFCSSLESVEMQNVTTIGGSAFSGCEDLTSISIPSGLINIGDQAFFDCGGLTSIIVDEGNTKYDSRDNCNAIIEKSSNTLIKGCNSTVIPNSVTSIGDSAFWGCNGLTSVTIPDGVTSIGSYAFAWCSNLTSVTIPDDVTCFGECLFFTCPNIKIYCNEGSAAWQYCKTNNIACEPLGSNPKPGPTPNPDPDSAPFHEHNWSWDTISEATEFSDGMEGYICSVCGATKDTVTIPSTGVFMEKRYDQVINAQAGDTVVLEMGLWHSLSKGFMEEIAQRRDVTFIIHSTYEHKNYEVVIPVGTPVVLDPKIDWYGILKQNQMFGMKEIL